MKPYSTSKCPIAGDLVYLPTYYPTEKTPYVIGGAATVATVDATGVQRERKLTVHEVPGVEYRWGSLKYEQPELHAKFKDSFAHLATEEEIIGLAEHRMAEQAKKDALRTAAVEAERKRWAPHIFQVLSMGLVETPIWGAHYRCRNWGAIVTLAPEVPGGLERWWFNRGSGPIRLIVPDKLKAHDVIEFGADYVRGSGYRDPERWYGVVTSIEMNDQGNGFITIQPCRDSLDAFKLSVELQTPPRVESAS